MTADVTTTVLHGGTLITGKPASNVFDPGAVAFEGDRIVAAGDEAEVLAAFPSARRLDARGGLILPGLINLHHHFYSALARGLAPGVPTRSFEEVLRGLWWRLDRALDPETIRLSARLTLAECVRSGCTTVFDHHASPSSIGGSLDLIRDPVGEIGLSAVLCYEISDRNGHAEALAGLEENLRFLGASASDPRVRGILGLHAAFTLSDTTLAECGRRLPPGAGVHVHAAEDAIDTAPIARLARHGLLGPDTLLAHGVHLSERELAEVAESGAVLVHNPESNAHNGVGRLDLLRAADAGCRIGLGTDGMSSNMLRSLRAAFLGGRDGRRDPTFGFDLLPNLMERNAAVARRFFGESLLGTLVPGAPADIAVFDAPSPTPVWPENSFAHLVYAASEAPVRHTIARGRVLLEDFEPRSFNLRCIASEARQQSPALWRRFRAIAP